eukprot:TRINITY_DN2654_c0_g1_i1.p1 TRINITY_DN2654_c0_g1~~TRINITY_DN2654_c0_g1_i1.p1  ORF type:complete len:234 (+),score=57.95 TRINITY_DN2654_c0_g1_i1:54-704(+)
MAHLFKDLSTDSAYIDRRPMLAMSELERAQYEEKYRSNLRKSTTVYVGNLPFNAEEDLLYSLFASVGAVKDIVMGLDRVKKSPCGFCFIEFARREGAEDAVRFLNGRKICGRSIRVDWDLGEARKENRYWGRGASGGQVRDEYRQDFDPGRGGLGARVSEIVGGGTLSQEARVYGTWAYTPFNVHDKRTTKRSRDLAASDPLYREYDVKKAREGTA